VKERGLVAMLERIADRATHTLVGAYQDALATMGDRPAGFTQTDPLDLLEHFITTCRTPGMWERVIEADAQVIGRDAAEALAARTVTNLGRMLARRGMGGTVPDDPVALQRAIEAGVEAVESMQLARRLRRAEQTLAKVEEVEARPKALVFRVPPPRETATLLLSPEEEPV
jgi:hypothetical protein